MKDIRSKLEKLESIWIDKQAPIISHLNPGLSKDSIISILTKEGISPDTDLVALYEWHNGVKTVYGFMDPLLAILPNGSFFNMQEMLALRQEFLEWDHTEMPNREQYIPFLTGGEDTMFLYQQITGKVYYLCPPAFIYGDLAFPSIDSMLECILECFEKGIFTIIPSEGLEVNRTEYFKVRKKYCVE